MASFKYYEIEKKSERCMTLNNLSHYQDHQELNVIMSLDLMLP